MRWLLIITLCVLPMVALANRGVVTAVIDGDTIEAGGQSIRLQGIDAPEAGQPHGNRATAALKSLILHREVRLRVRGTDRYDRLIAVVYRGERNVNRWLVRNGHASEYDKYSEDPALGRPERTAREVHLGLWAANDPVPPWQWRDRPKPGHESSKDIDCSDFNTHAAAQRGSTRIHPETPTGSTAMAMAKRASLSDSLSVRCTLKTEARMRSKVIWNG